MAEQSEPDLITVYDDRGRELRIERSVWERDVLQPNLHKAWSAPDPLYGHLVQALDDGFAPRVLPAAERLVEIDGASERALLVYAIALLRTGDLSGAEAQIRRCFEKHGETASALANLAKVYDARGEHEQSATTLRRAVEVDPNLENTLLWWAAAARERGGQSAYLSALEEAARFAGAWRPQLWLARANLQAGNRDAALGIYAEVLPRAAHERGALMMISGDLGNAGALAELVSVVAPHYDAERVGPQAGVNIAEALKELGRIDEAQAMVNSLLRLGIPPLAERLGRLDRELAEKRAHEAPAATPQVSSVQVVGPLWGRGLSDPSWLFPARAENAPELFFVVFSNETLSGAPAGPQTVDDAGRLTRALPLYLSEAFQFAFDVKARCLVFIVQGQGPVVFGAPMDRESIRRLVPPSPARQIAIVGSLIASGVRVEAWDLQQPEPVAVLNVARGGADMGALAGQLFQELAAALSARKLIAPAPVPPYYRAPSDALRTGYVSAIEQLLYQVLAANEVVPAESLWNERGFFETYFDLVEAWPDAPDNARLIAVSGVMAAVKYKSSLVEPYRKLVLRWLEEVAPGSVLDRLAPAVLKRLGETARLTAWHERAPAVNAAGYAAWLERVRQE